MIQCPACGHWLDDAHDLAGQFVACPFCGNRFAMPGAVRPIAQNSGPAIDTRRRYYSTRRRPRKNVLVAVLLTLFLGPIGLFYVSPIGGGIMTLAAVMGTIFLLALSPVTLFAGLYLIPVLFAAIHIISVFWAVAACGEGR